MKNHLKCARNTSQQNFQKSINLCSLGYAFETKVFRKVSPLTAYKPLKIKTKIQIKMLVF